jgi:hypothetical protein
VVRMVQQIIVEKRSVETFNIGILDVVELTSCSFFEGVGVE